MLYNSVPLSVPPLIAGDGYRFVGSASLLSQSYKALPHIDKHHRRNGFLG